MQNHKIRSDSLKSVHYRSLHLFLVLLIRWLNKADETEIPTANVTLRCVRATVAEVEKQEELHILSVRL